MKAPILACCASLLVLIWELRRGRSPCSLGIPLAYLLMLLMIHVPGAMVHTFPWADLPETAATQRGIELTAIGTIAFVTGVILGRIRLRRKRTARALHSIPERFLFFSLLAGWFVIFALDTFIRVPSVSAVIEKGGAIWMLGVMLGLRNALRSSYRFIFFWLALMAIYPAVMLLIGGFLGYGFATIIICLAPLAISVRSPWKMAIGATCVVTLGFNLFLSYFQNRDQLRSEVWGGGAMGPRLRAASAMWDDLHWFNPHNPADLAAVDERLNQNYFVGLSAMRIEEGGADLLEGKSIVEGLEAFVPRILWPDKPVFGGSPGIVMEMTGLQLSETTSWGIGQVMEFYINFGIPSLVIGFILLGALLARLDLMAATAAASGDIPKLFRTFLPAVALIGPQWSIVELASGAAAAFVAAIGWSFIWERFVRPSYRVIGCDLVSFSPTLNKTGTVHVP